MIVCAEAVIGSSATSGTSLMRIVESPSLSVACFGYVSLSNWRANHPRRRDGACSRVRRKVETAGVHNLHTRKVTCADRGQIDLFASQLRVYRRSRDAQRAGGRQ